MSFLFALGIFSEGIQEVFPKDNNNLTALVMYLPRAYRDFLEYQRTMRSSRKVWETLDLENSSITLELHYERNVKVLAFRYVKVSSLKFSSNKWSRQIPARSVDIILNFRSSDVAHSVVAENHVKLLDKMR